MGKIKKIGVLTSGGDAPGMNAAIRAVVRSAVYHAIQVAGIRHGYQGMIDSDFIPMYTNSVSDIIQWGGSPSAIDRVNASRLGNAAIEALLDDQKSVMAGLQNGKIVLVPFRKAVKLHKDVNRSLIEPAHILSV